MAMSEGTVTINPTTGEATGSGCAKEVFDELDSCQGYCGLTGVALAQARERIAGIARAVAKVVPHIVTNAVVSTNVNTTGTASDVASGAATAPVTSSGSGSGTVS